MKRNPGVGNRCMQIAVTTNLVRLLGSCLVQDMGALSSQL